MITMNSLAMVFFQDLGASAHDVHLTRIYICLIAVALMIQAIGILGVAVYAAIFLSVLRSISRDVHEKALPMIEKTTALVSDLTPKIHSIGTNVEQVSFTVREKIDELGVTVSQLNQTIAEANGRTRVQVARVDGIVTEALEATEDISRTVQQGIRVPVREIAGIIAGIKVAVETLIARFPFGKR